MASKNNDSGAMFTGVYVVGVISCWYHGVGFWVSIFWPWYLGAVFLGAGK